MSPAIRKASVMLPSINSLKLPDIWQHQAVNLRAGTDVVVSAPTGAGKTYIFEPLHISRARSRERVTPCRLGHWRTISMLSGRKPNGTSASLRVMFRKTLQLPCWWRALETQLERLVRGEGPSLLVIDEYQMIADATRGSHYEAAIALAPKDTRLLLLSGSVANPEDIVAWLRRLGRTAEVVMTKERPVPLDEAPWEALPQRMARHFEHFWPKLAAAVMLADMAPLLIFSPRRKEAESIARRLAADLPHGESLR